MINIISRMTMLYVAVVCVAALLSFTDAVAQPGFARNRVIEHVAPPAPYRRTVHPSIGWQVRVLPNKHQVVRVGSSSYHYYDGSFYRRQPQGIYVVVGAPLGARVRGLSPGYVSFGLGSHRYFYSNLTYYLRDSRTQEYIVIEEPSGAVAAVVAASESGSGEIFVYPNLGQSDEQRDRDRYECYLWAVEQTSFDPGAANPDLENAGNYRRAHSACLEGRGYTVK